jgi:hypothetical protein
MCNIGALLRDAVGSRQGKAGSSAARLRLMRRAIWISPTGRKTTGDHQRLGCGFREGDNPPPRQEFGVAAGHFIMGDPLTPAFAAAVIFVVAGLVLVNRPR